MLGKLSIIGAVAAILTIPTALSAQMGGAVSPGVHVGGAVNPGATVRGAVERGIPGPDLGTWRSPSREVHLVVSILPQSSAACRRSAMHSATAWRTGSYQDLQGNPIDRNTKPPASTAQPPARLRRDRLNQVR
jgi:hypothetical protein